jgi:hypothetical protein
MVAHGLFRHPEPARDLETASLSGNSLGCSCFHIFILSCCEWSVIVRWHPSLSAAIVTQLVTRLQARTQAAASLVVGLVRKVISPCLVAYGKNHTTLPLTGPKGHNDPRLRLISDVQFSWSATGVSVAGLCSVTTETPAGPGR